MPQVIDNPVLIRLFMLKAQLTAIKLEVAGMKHSRGSVCALVKKMFNIKGRTKQEVYDNFAEFVKRQEVEAQNILSGQAQLN